MDIAQLSQTEPVSSGRVHVAVHGHQRTAGLDLEHLTNLDVQLKVGDRAPELRTCRWTETQSRGQGETLSCRGHSRDVSLDRCLTWMVGHRLWIRSCSVMLRPCRDQQIQDQVLHNFTIVLQYCRTTILHSSTQYYSNTQYYNTTLPHSTTALHNTTILHYYTIL